MKADSFAHETEHLLKKAGLTDAHLIEARPETEHGYAEAIFHLGSLLLRFVLDRGQKFLDIASVETPKHFHQDNDVEVLMGWTTIGKVLDERTEPEPLESILARLKTRFKALDEAFGRERHEATNAQLEKISRMRGEASSARNRQRATHKG